MNDAQKEIIKSKEYIKNNFLCDDSFVISVLLFLLTLVFALLLQSVIFFIVANIFSIFFIKIIFYKTLNNIKPFKIPVLFYNTLTKRKKINEITKHHMELLKKLQLDSELLELESEIRKDNLNYFQLLLIYRERRKEITYTRKREMLLVLIEEKQTENMLNT